MIRRFGRIQLSFFILSIVYMSAGYLLLRKYPEVIWPDSYEYLSYRDCLKTGECATCTAQLINGRSPSIPVVYALLKSQTFILRFQVITFLFSFVWLAFCAFRKLNYSIAGLFLGICILIFSFNFNIFFWPRSLLSEAFSITLCNLLIGLILVASTVKKRYQDILLYCLWLILLVLFVFTKDLHALLAFGIPAIFLLFTKNIKGWKWKAVTTFSLLVVLFIINQKLIEKSGRYYLPTLNVFAKKYHTDPYFTKMADASGVPVDTCIANHTGMYAFKAPCYRQLDTGYVKQLYKAHQQMIITHPTYAVITPMYAYRNIITGTVYDYSQTGYRPKWMRVIKSLFWDWLLWLSLPLCIFLYIKKRITLFQLCLFWGTAIFIVGTIHLSFLADSNEIERHTLIPNYLLRIILLVIPFCMNRLPQHTLLKDQISETRL